VYINFSYPAHLAHRIYTMLNKKTSKFSQYIFLSLSTSLSKRVKHLVSGYNPTNRFISLPLLIIKTVGIALRSYCSAIVGAPSIFTSQAVTLQACISISDCIVRVTSLRGDRGKKITPHYSTFSISFIPFFSAFFGKAPTAICGLSFSGTKRMLGMLRMPKTAANSC